MASKIKISIVGDESDGVRSLNRYEKEFDGFGSRVSGGIGKLGGVLAGLGAGLAVGDFIKGGIDSLTNMDRIISQTDAAVKSTGGAARVSTEHISELANSIERATGVEAENVQAGQNMLLTFTNIKNGVGAGNDIFDQATNILTDMSVALGTDASTSAVQLGKALNDPIKGVTALQKVGVSFDEQQKKQIETMVKAGDTAGAQKLILAELNKEFGGSAKAFGDSSAGGIAKFKNELGNLQDQLASALLPAIKDVTTYLAENLPKAVDFVQQAFDRAKPGIEVVKTLFSDLKLGFEVVIDAFRNPGVDSGGFVGQVQQFAIKTREVFDDVRAWINEVLPQVQEAIGHFVNAAIAIWNVFGDDILRVARGAFEIVKSVITTAINVVKDVIELALAIINGDWGKAWDAIKQLVSDVWDGIKGVISGALEALKGVLGAAWEVIKTGVGLAWDAIKSVVSSAWDSLKESVTTGIGDIVRWMGELPGKVTSAVGDLAKTLYNKGKDLLRGAHDGVVDGQNLVMDFVADLGKKILDKIGDLSRLLYDVGKKIIKGLVDGIGDSFDSVKNKFGELTGKMPGWKGPPSRDAGLLTPAGRTIIGSLMAGIDQQTPALKAQLNRLTDAMSTGVRTSSDAGVPTLPAASTTQIQKHYHFGDVKVERSLDELLTQLVAAEALYG